MRNNIVLFVVVFVLALLGGCWFFSQYIGLVSMNEVVKQDWADLDAQLQFREDLIPDLVSAVKDRVPTEEDVFTGIADARGRLASATTPSTKAEAEEALTAALDRLLLIAENCPELNADETFIRLLDELADAEKRIRVSRRRYNENVEIYNMCTRGFLVSYVAGHIGLNPREKFEPLQVTAEAHGEDVPDGAESGE